MESIVIQGRCRQTRKLFRVHFAHDGGHYYRVESVRGGSSVSAAVQDSHLLESGHAKSAATEAGTVSAVDGTEVSAWALDWSGAACPYCDAGSEYGMSVVQCGGCAGVICGDGGKKRFNCPHCRQRLNVGVGGKSIESFLARPSAPARSDAPALPPGRGLLGSAKRLLPRGKVRR
jgi:hypothetical protein